MEYIPAVVAVLAALSGIILGWTGRGREQRREIEQDVSTDVRLQSDVDYIKRGIDDIRVEQRSQRQELKEMDTRLTRVEESAKQAHKRLDANKGGV